jgi:hypothetical protein
MPNGDAAAAAFSDRVQPLRAFGSRKTLAAVVLAGTTVGTLDLIYAISIWWLQGVPAKVIPLSIASGAVGEAAFAGGGAMIILGAALHYSIALMMAGAFLFATSRWPSLVSRPYRIGAAYGTFLYLLMNFLVVPLSRAPLGRPPVLIAFADLGAHVLLVGIPIVLIASRTRA